MKNKIYISFGLCLLLVGCTNQSEDKPIVQAKEAITAPSISKPTSDVVTKTSSSIKSKTTSNINLALKTETNFKILKDNIYKILNTKQFNPQFEEQVLSLWPSLQKMEKRELINKLLHTNNLSKSYMGRKPYRLSSMLIKLKLEPQENLYLLDSLRHNQQPDIQTTKDYLRTLFNKNYGSNYYEWKKEILKQN